MAPHHVPVRLARMQRAASAVRGALPFLMPQSPLCLTAQRNSEGTAQLALCRTHELCGSRHVRDCSSLVPDRVAQRRSLRLCWPHTPEFMDSQALSSALPQPERVAAAALSGTAAAAAAACD
eukprot:TRINITY_DN5945_c0_g1_i1.p2 TRINITY_DN5945_c0_g1~~TRINITY_DN5945_c0_g1_i1.p2  ORF type:complete len:122 (+),score=28.32 TRINITY_DN5945_c0_g1_i1:441-806(+)